MEIFKGRNPEYKPRKKTDKAREQRLKYYYGISIEQYDSLLTKQNNSCYICERDSSHFKKRLAVDHCHRTGEVRGLLCWQCNHAIGTFKDNKERLIKAAEYVQQGTGWFVPDLKRKTGGKRRRRKKK